MEDAIDPGVGFAVCVKVGDTVSAGDPLVRIRWRDPDRLAAAHPLVERAMAVGEGPATPLPLILQEVR
jgi:thymidine phosphorylase